MLHACVERFNVTSTLGKNLELNGAFVSWCIVLAETIILKHRYMMRPWSDYSWSENKQEVTVTHNPVNGSRDKTDQPNSTLIQARKSKSVLSKTVDLNHLGIALQWCNSRLIWSRAHYCRVTGLGQSQWKYHKSIMTLNLLTLWGERKEECHEMWKATGTILKISV